MAAKVLFQFDNNSAGKLLADISAVSTSCSLQSGQGSNFPTADHDGGAGATAFNVTLVKATGEREICLCERTAGSDVITFVDPTSGAASVNGRAQEGTSALAFEAGDQVELRLTAAQIQYFEDQIETNKLALEGATDHLDSDHLPGGADENDHDDRYYTETEIDASYATLALTYARSVLWTQAELAAAGGGAPIHAAHLTNKTSIAHSEITDDQATKHRLINDSAGNGDTTELWSANKIYDQLALKSATSHTHDRDHGTIVVSSGNSRPIGLGTSSFDGNWYDGTNPSSTGVTSNNESYANNKTIWMPVYLTPVMTRYYVGALVGNSVGNTTNVRLRILIADLNSGSNISSSIGTTRETGSEWTTIITTDKWGTYESPAGTMTIPGDGWYIVGLQSRINDNDGPTSYYCLYSYWFMAAPASIS